MNKQEAIQSQIDEIMDNFDFNKCMIALNKVGFGLAEKRPFEEYELRKFARERINDAVRREGTSHSGAFCAKYTSGVDVEGKWLRIDLKCVIEHWPNDGAGYE